MPAQSVVLALIAQEYAQWARRGAGAEVQHGQPTLCNRRWSGLPKLDADNLVHSLGQSIYHYPMWALRQRFVASSLALARMEELAPMPWWPKMYGRERMAGGFGRKRDLAHHIRHEHWRQYAGS